MNPRVDALNRVVLTVLGLLLVAAGGLGLAAGAGAFRPANPRVLPPDVRHYARTTTWFWWAVAGFSLLVALLALAWLIAQLRSERASRLDLTVDDRDGVTMVHAGALTDAVAGEAESLRGVSGASANLRDRRGKRLHLAVELTDYADIPDVRRALEDRVVVHARQAIDAPDLPVQVELRQGARGNGERGLR